jgi:hypothetical protein
LNNQQGFNNQRVRPGLDIEAMISVGDALRGSETLHWRICNGIITPKILPHKFMIVSIQHLLYREDPATGEMLRLPIGTAAPQYLQMLTSAKIQFPNQIQSTSGNTKDDRFNHAAVDAVRLQLEINERVFVDMLQRLDKIETRFLPKTKSEWQSFIDMGALVLELYATLAFGYMHGGAKVIDSYSKAIMIGRWDPMSLFPNGSKSDERFR